MNKIVIMLAIVLGFFSLNADATKKEEQVFNPSKDLKQVFFSDTLSLLSMPEFYYSQGDALNEMLIEYIDLVGTPFKMPDIKKRFNNEVKKKLNDYSEKSNTVFEKKYTKHIKIHNIPLMTESNYDGNSWSLEKLNINDGISTGRYTNPEGYVKYDRKIIEKLFGLDKFDFTYKYAENNAPIIITQNAIKVNLNFILSTEKAIEMYNKTKGIWDLSLTFVPKVEFSGASFRLGDDTTANIININWELTQAVEKNSGFIFEYKEGWKRSGFSLK